MTEPIVVNTEEAAVRLGRSTRYVQRLAAAKTLKVVGTSETGGFWFRKSDVEKLAK